jgi:hypothetical protein
MQGGIQRGCGVSQPASLSTKQHDGSPSDNSFPARIVRNAGFGLTFSRKQATPANACQWASNPIHPLLSQMKNGKHSHRLRQQKQSINRLSAWQRILAQLPANVSGAPRFCANRRMFGNLVSTVSKKREVELLSFFSIGLPSMARSSGNPFRTADRVCSVRSAAMWFADHATAGAVPDAVFDTVQVGVVSAFMVVKSQRSQLCVVSIAGVLSAEAGRAVLESCRGRNRRTPGSSNDKW